MLPADTPPEPLLVTPVPVEVRVSAERVRVDQQAHMGLAGLHLLRPLGDHAFAGISVFGATHGDRGGFFGWGLSGGGRLRSGPWQAEAGMFAGGGGGSPSWVGGGLMLRPHAALAYRWNDLTLALGVAQVRFPNGAVRSTHPFANLDVGSLGLFGPPNSGNDSRAPGNRQPWAVHAIPNDTSASIARYSMRHGSARRDGQGDGPPLVVGGVTFRRDLSGMVAGLQPYWLLSAGGGVSAAYAGYAELLGGLGVRNDLSGLPLSLRAEAALGSGGAGAAADTGGGGLRKLLAGASWQIRPSLALTALAGRTSTRGPFQANEQRLELAWRGWDVLPGERRSSGDAPAALEWAPWALASSVVVHPRVVRDDGTQPALSLITLRLERELDSHWRLTAQAGIATSGRAGGYATGQLGVAWLTAPQPDTPWRVGVAASLGAAGGGGVRVGNGWVADAQLLARVALSPQWALQAEAGWLRGGRGAVTTPQVGVSAVFAFSRLQGMR